MFFNAPSQPTKLKKTAYLTAAAILGAELGLIVYALAEINYLNFIQSRGQAAPFYNGSALLPAFSFVVLLLGASGGFFLGRFWWRLVYVERVWAKRYAKK